MNVPRYANGRQMVVVLNLSKNEARALLAMMGQACIPADSIYPAIFDRLKQAVKTYERHEKEQLQPNLRK